MKRLLFLLLFVSRLAAGVTLIPEPLNPTIPNNANALPYSAGETSSIVDGSSVDVWFAGGYPTPNWTHLYYCRASDALVRSYSNPVLVMSGIRFPYVVRHEDAYYLFATKTADGNMYLWRSTDKVTFTIQNRGVPVFSKSNDANSTRYTLYNPGVVIIDGIWHLFLETSPAFNPGHTFSVLHSSSNLLEMNWGIRASAPVFTLGHGNPNPIHVPNRNAVIVLIYQTDLPTGLGDIVAYTAPDTANFGLFASWKQSPSFRIHDSGMIAADPDLVVLPPGKAHKLMIRYLHNQNESYQLYSDLTLEEFYDAVAGWGADGMYLTAPNGTKYRLNVSNSGQLTTSPNP